MLMPGCENPPTGFLQLLTWVDLSRDNSVLRQAAGLEALVGQFTSKPSPLPSACRSARTAVWTPSGKKMQLSSTVEVC